jgi:hypothetical protein
MADIVQSLFGITPEIYQQSQQARADQQAMQYAKLSPFEQANYAIGRGANMLGGAVARGLGGEDPELARISMRQQIARQLNPNDPASIQQAISALSQAGDGQGAMMLQGEYQKLIESNALVGQRGAAEKASLAQAAKTEFGIKQEEKLRDELSALGPNATQDQILSVVTKYGPPEKVLAALQGSADRATANQARIDAANLANQARIDAAKVAADAKLEAARMAGATAKEIAQMRVDSARELRLLATSLKGPKVLAPSLQKEEDKELELVDSLTARESSLAPAIASLTVDPKTGKPPLELGPVNNLRYQAQNAAGNSSIESRNYASLQRAVQEATNLKTDAAKGVQTDKDVLRFANELIAAFGGNDTKTTLEALSNFSKSTAKARENAQKRIDSRRTSQGVEPYYGPARGSAQNPIKLD